MTTRLTNIKRGGTEQLNIDPVTRDVEYDGQKYTFGPGHEMNLPSGIANSLATQSADASVVFDKAGSGKKYPDDNWRI